MPITRVRAGDVFRDVIAPGRTDAVPVARVAGPTGPAASYPLPLQPGPAPTYQLELRVPGGAATGTYLVTYSYAVAGVPGSSATAFEVVPGGDSGGRVISLFDYDRPEGRYLLAQLDSGQLVQGKGPYL